MTEPQTITADHLRALLAADDADAFIGLIGGGVEVIGSAQRDSEEHRGAFEVISRADLEERLGGEADEEHLQAEADALTASVQELGG